jgi:hypothetical protein
MKKILAMILLLAFLIPAAACAYDYTLINIRGGLSYPLGDLGVNTDLSWDAGASARKGLDRNISVGGGVSYVTMPYKDSSAPQPFSTTIIDAEMAYAPYMPDFFIWPYAKIGVGLFMAKYAILTGTSPNYTADTKQETAFGFMLGGGILYPITNEIAANAELMYNQVSLSGGTGDAYTFFTLNAGITIFIK